MEIKRREIIASISIIAIMLLVGILLSGKISEFQMDANEKYNKAIKIESEELFKYGMNTNAGNAFIYGELEAVDTVGYSEIDGKYLSVKKVKERYTMHTRTVTTTVNGKTTTRTETYWTWDVVGKEQLQSKKIKFLGIEFNSTQFNIPSASYICTIKESSHIRYKYYGYPAKSKGTIFTYLADGNIEKEGIEIYKDMTIEQTVDYLESGVWVIVFWVFWLIFIGIVVFLFCLSENRWLDS